MLPADFSNATLAGRLLLDDGPTPVLIRDGAVEDVSRTAPTISDLMDLPDPANVRGEITARMRGQPPRDVTKPTDAIAGNMPGDPYSAPPQSRPFRDD